MRFVFSQIVYFNLVNVFVLVKKEFLDITLSFQFDREIERVKHKARKSLIFYSFEETIVI